MPCLQEQLQKRILSHAPRVSVCVHVSISFCTKTKGTDAGRRRNPLFLDGAGEREKEDETRKSAGCRMRERWEMHGTERERRADGRSFQDGKCLLTDFLCQATKRISLTVHSSSSSSNCTHSICASCPFPFLLEA